LWINVCGDDDLHAVAADAVVVVPVAVVIIVFELDAVIETEGGIIICVGILQLLIDFVDDIFGTGDLRFKTGVIAIDDCVFEILIKSGGIDAFDFLLGNITVSSHDINFDAASKISC
jgi:hypothetical protein